MFPSVHFSSHPRSISSFGSFSIYFNIKAHTHFQQVNMSVFNCFSFTSTYSISNWLAWMLFPLSVLAESNRLKPIIFLQCQVFVADSKKLFWITVHQNVLYIILSRLFPSLPDSILRLQGGSGRETVCHKNPLQLLSSDTELKSTSGRGDIDQVS